MEDRQKVSLLQLFFVFAKIGAFTIGGGMMIIPAIQAEMSRRKWIPDAELPDIIALSQSAPGLLAVNMSIFAGYRLRGIKGSVVATIGSVLPSFIIILLIAMVFSNFRDNPWVIKAFKAIRPVVVALILVPTIRLGRQNVRSWWAWIIALFTLIGVAFLKFSPVYILLCIMIIAFAISLYNDKKTGGGLNK